MDRETVSIEEIIKRLGIGRNSTYAALQRGEIPHIKIGRRYIVIRAQFERFLSVEGTQNRQGRYGQAE